jgi:hypothetical protein
MLMIDCVAETEFMTVLIKRFLLVLLASIGTLGLTSPSRADAPSGVVSFSFSTNDAAIYDFTGSLQFDQTMIGAGQTEIPLSYGINITQDARGFLTGSGTIEVAAGDNFVAADYIARGKVSTRGGLTRISLVVRLKGNDAFGGLTTPFSITISYSLTVAPESGTLEGTARGSARFGRLGNSRIRTDVSVALPAGADGNWTLLMNIAPFNRLGGTASVILSNGRTLNFNLSGRFSSSLDRSTVHLSAFADSRGNTLTVIFNPDLLLLRARLFGQSAFQ